jgi:hypothetical protein
VADPLGVDHGLAAVGRGDCLRLGPHPLLPRISDLSAHVQAVDAGMVGFQVRPEHAQLAGQLFQAPVIHPGLAFPQVVDQQVTDGPAGQVMPVDHLLWSPLARGAQFPQPRRRCRAEGPQLAQQPVAGRGLASGGTGHAGLGVEQLQDVADLDASEHPALGRQDHRGPAQRVIPGGFRHRAAGPVVAQVPQPREALRVTVCGHGPRQLSVTSGSDQPRQGRAHHVAGDHRDQRRRQRAEPAHAREVPATRPPGRQLPPGAPGLLGAAGQPPLLPAVTVLVLQPVQQQAPPSLMPACRTPARQVFHLIPVGPGSGPARSRRTRREPGPCRPVARQPHGRGRGRRPGARRHDVPFPNSTSSVSRR